VTADYVATHWLAFVHVSVISDRVMAGSMTAIFTFLDYAVCYPYLRCLEGGYESQMQVVHWKHFSKNTSTLMTWESMEK
jgi:hypothetical protein